MSKSVILRISIKKTNYFLLVIITSVEVYYDESDWTFLSKFYIVKATQH
jgi:hypothetical protein